MDRPLRFLTAFLVIGAFACSSSDSDGLRFQSAIDAVQSVEAGSPYSLTVRVSGADPAATFALTAAPTGMTVSNTGDITWDPSLADLGQESVTLVVNDADETITAQWTVWVHQGVLMGTAYSPPGFESNTTTAGTINWLQDGSDGFAIGYHTNWRDAGATMGEIPGFLSSGVAARDQFGVVPTFVVGWADGNGLADLTSDSEPGNNTWSNLETRQEFVAMVTAFAQSAQPARLALANEFNIWWASNQALYADWESLYEEAYDAIKAVSPGTDVYATFQLEFLKDEAQTTGWTGGDTWACFDSMEATGKLDVAAFTSYPYFGAATPAAMASDHYGEIALHWPAGPVTFTEIGWLAAQSGPYPGSTADQAAFVDRFFELTTDLDLDVVQWLFAHDFDGQAMFPPFVGVGLRNNDGSVARPADGAWRDQVELRQVPSVAFP